MKNSIAILLLQSTYKHEARHIENGRNAIDKFAKPSSLTNFATKEKCEEQAGREYNLIMDKWASWYKDEGDHKNPESPQYGGRRTVDYPCQ